MAGVPHETPAQDPARVYSATPQSSTQNKEFASGGLSPAHRRMLEEESGICPEIVSERGYRTVESSAELGEFKKYQRQPGLLIPVYSPSGRSGFRLRPDRPRRGKDGKPRKYEQPGATPNMLDVHPRNAERLRDARADLWATEGEKKADKLASHGLCSVALFGVWGWCAAGTRGEELSPDWDHIALEGRRVYIVFDADVMVKENVQLALERLVAALELRGAEVRVVYLPGPEKGVDDYLVAGGSVSELKALAREFEPQDLGRVRLSRDEKLRAGVEDLRRRHSATRWTWPGADSDEDIYLKIIEAAGKYGKVHAEGLRVEKAQGPLGLEAKVSNRTIWKSLNRLEERGYLRRDNEGRKSDKAGAFVLYCETRAGVSHQGQKLVTSSLRSPRWRRPFPYDLHSRAPRMMASRPKWKPTKKMIREHRLGVRTWMPEPREGVKRLGKRRGHALDRLDAAGGALPVKELAEQLGTRPRDLVRRKRSSTGKGRDGLLICLEEAGIVVIDGDTVSVTPDWLERLEDQRQLGGEIEAEEVARRRYRARSRAYHDRNKVLQSKPSAAGLEAVRRSRATRDARLQEIARAEEERRRAGPPPAFEAFLSGILGQHDRIRMGLLCELAMEEGFNHRDVPDVVVALGFCVKSLPEYGGAQFVFAPVEGAA